MQLNLNEKLFHYINNLRKLILRTIYFEIFVRINKTVANKMIHSIFKKKKFLNWTTNDLKKVFEKKLFELSINQIFEKHKIFIANNEIVISIIQNQILNEMITFASNLISSRTSNKRSVLQNTMNISFFFHFRHYIFFIASIHRRILSKSIVMKNFTQSSIQFFFVDVTKKIENKLFEIFINFVYFENASIKKRCTCVASVFKFWKKTTENFEIFFFVNCASFIIKWYETSEICHVHNKNATEKLNMTTNYSSKMLKQRLIHIYQNRNRFDDVKTTIEIYRWFCTNAKFVRIIDRFDSYRFFHVDISKYRAFVEILLTKNFIQTKLNK